MRNSSLFFIGSLAAAFYMPLVGCGDDAGSDSPGTGGSGNTGNSTNTSSSGTGGAGGEVNTKQTQEVSGDITSDTTFTEDKNWLLKGVVRVGPGATLTIEPGTIVYGDKATTGTLVVQQGGKIEAVGTADMPIVFTSQLPVGERAAGDWGGVVLLGRAPINEAGGTAAIEGFTTDEIYGGSDAADSSGTMKYVRIEFSGIEISPDNEINGLTLGGVGSGTTLDYVQVRHTLDDCFEFFGGTVNGSHLVCYRNGDDGFDFDQGYVGNLQFLFLQQDPYVADSANGFEADNDAEAPDSVPVSDPTIWNVTLCGQHADVASQQFGFLFRRGFNATIGNAIVTGFEGGVDFRDKPYTNVDATYTVFFDNAPENVAYLEDGSNADTEADDDSGFDERAWFAAGEGNSEADPGLGDCFSDAPNALPAAMIPGGTPPSNGFFDTSATYVGAFADASDTWMTGAWVSWSQN